MKRLLFILVSVFCLSTLTTYAQEVIEQDSKAVKLSAKELARQEKEREKAAKDSIKADRAHQKKQAKKEKRENLEVEYYEFISNYEPIPTNTGYKDVDDFFKSTNELFAILVDVEQQIGFIEIITHEEIDDITGDTIQVVDGIVHKETREPIKKSDALETYTTATLQLTSAAATAATLSLGGVSAILSAIDNPFAAIPVVTQVKKIGKSVKMSVNMIPIIQGRIQENKDALNFKRNNEVENIEVGEIPADDQASLD